LDVYIFIDFKKVLANSRYIRAGGIDMLGRRSKVAHPGRKGGKADSRAPRRRMKRKGWNRYGVSEIIGNLLIPALTVTLFSGIFWYVASMPAPTQNVYGNFVGSIDFRTGSYCDLTIKHLGGQSLNDATTNIYIITDTDHLTLKISDSNPSIGTKWTMGSTWHYNTTTDARLLAINSTSNLSILIVDTEKGIIVWKGSLLGNGASTSIPVILDRYLAEKVSDEVWLKATSFTDKQEVALFANVLYGGSDALHVYADVSSLGGPSNLELIDTNADGWYSMDFRIVSSVGTKYISITAVDSNGRTGTSTLAVDIYSSTSDPINGGHGNGSAPGNLRFSNLQGVNIFKYKDWIKYNYTAIPTDKFEKADQQAVVVVASKFLVNLENGNTLYILNNRGEVMTAASSDNAFVSYDFFSGYYVYQAFIDLSKLTDNSQYYAQVQLRDSYLPNNNQFLAILPFTVGTSTQPRMETYSDEACTKPCTSFTTSSTIYVKIFNSPVGIWNQNAGLVEIVDYSWNMQVKRIPGSSGSIGGLSNPVSNLTKDGTTYKFSINLSAANQAPWLPGNSSYMLRYDTFTVSGQQFLLSKMIDVQSPKIVLDLVAADNSASLKGGWSSGTMIDYYSNDNQWVPPDMIQSWDNKHQSQYDQAKFVRLGNFFSSGKLDVVAVLLSGNANLINIYRNDGSWTPIPVESNGRGTITAIEVGVLDTSAGDDIIVGYSTGEVGFYRNDGTWTYQMIGKVSNSAVTSLTAIDVLNTKAIYGTPLSEYVVAGYSSSVTSSYPIYIWENLDGTGTPGMWHPIPYVGQVSNIKSAIPNDETSITAYREYGDFRSAGLGSNSYETLAEKYKTATFYARSAVPAVDSTPFIVLNGQTFENNLWNRWNATPSNPITSVRIEVSYYTSTYFSGSVPIMWALNGSSSYATGTNLVQSTSTTNPKVVSFTVTGVSTVEDLFNLKVKFTNTAPASFTFQYWRMYITFQSQAATMDHYWTFRTSEGGTNTLEFMAKVSGANESFIFQYAQGSGAYTSFNPALVVASGDYVKYVYNLPVTSAATDFKIRVIDSNPNSDWTTNTTLSIKNLCINTTVLKAGSIGLPVTDLEAYDMNLDGYEDLIISDGQNIWICYNNRAGSLTSKLPTQVTSGSNQIPNIISIGVGVISSQSDYPGVVVAAGSSKTYQVYVLAPDADGSFDTTAKISVYSSSTQIIKLVGADVDGDGDVDFVISTASNQIVYYRNDGSGKFNGWIIDTLPMGINDISLGKIQNN
jgi:hypothetical protein